ncbi:hypothetical protein [Persephonella sp. KM09-Lau-8]|uniref:hypothetical protein n=1 Tax=Persephonella sp. KM09-Lau-8 TaxID=1158345 RepID=UPI000495D851|nr:hypothetical protein [Persephonella sp. KM09-Lau-8]
MKNFKDVWGWAFSVFGIPKLFWILFFLMLGTTIISFIPIIGNITILIEIVFFSASLKIAKIFDESFSQQEYKNKLASLEFKKLLFDEIIKATAVFLGFIIIMVISFILVFLPIFLIIFKGATGGNLDFYDALYVLPFLVVISIMFYMYPYIIGKIALRSETFEDALKTMFSFAFPSELKKVLFNLKYFVLSLKAFLVILVVGIVFAISLIPTFPALETLDENEFNALLVLNYLYISIVYSFVYLYMLFFMSNYYALAYKVVNEKTESGNSVQKQQF